MASQLTLYNAVASWSFVTNLNVISLVGNTGTQGMSKFDIGDKLTGASLYTMRSSTTKCINNTIQPYISNLYDIIFVTAATAKLDYAIMKAYNCISGDNCGTLSCTTYNSTLNSQAIDLYIDYAIDVEPGPITSLTLTPGDGNLIANFNAPSNIPVYGYGVSLWQGATKLTGGYILATNFVINGLTNGITYELRVQPVSYDYRFSSTVVSGTGIPKSACTTPACTFIIT